MAAKPVSPKAPPRVATSKPSEEESSSLAAPAPPKRTTSNRKFSGLGPAPDCPPPIAEGSPSDSPAKKPSKPEKPFPPKPEKPLPQPPANPSPAALAAMNSSSSSSLPPPLPTAVPDKRTFIARELLSTELSYLDGLEGLTSQFQKPLEEVLTPMEKQILFQHVGSLLKFHQALYKDLSERLEVWDSNPCLGDLLKKASPYLKLYTSYVNNFNKVQVVLEGINKNQAGKAFQVLLSCQHKQMQGPLGFSSLLMTPVQRIPRYVLLLKDLMEKTPPDHPDYEELSESYDKVCAIASEINESKRREENIQKIAEIYSKLDDETKQKVSEALVENSHSWEKTKAENDLTCILCQKEIAKGTKVYHCPGCKQNSHGAPKRCYEKVPRTCGMDDDDANLVKARRDLLRTGSALHRAVHTAEQYDGVATNKFSKEIQEKKKADVFLFNDIILVLWEKSLDANAPLDEHGRKKGLKSLMSTSPYEFCTLFHFYNATKRELATVKRLAPTVLEIHPPGGGVVHSLYYETPEECDTWFNFIEERIRGSQPKEEKVEIDEHGSTVDHSRPVWFTLPSVCPVPDGAGGSFMAYIVNMKFRDSDQERVVLKRYNQFFILHQKLKKQVGKKNLPYFPPKKWVGNMKPKFVVKRRAELSSYLNQLDVKYLQLSCVKHFLSTGCETMEGEVGEHAFDIDVDEEGNEDPNGEPDQNQDEEEEQPVGVFMVLFDFVSQSSESQELSVYTGDKILVYPSEEEDPMWVWCRKGEQCGYVPRRYIQKVEE